MQNDTKKRKKRTNRTHMSGSELIRLRQEMKFQPCHMYRTLGIPRRTYQDYEAGKRGIPAKLAARIREMHQKDRAWMAGIGERVDVIERGEIA